MELQKLQQIVKSKIGFIPEKSSIQTYPLNFWKRTLEMYNMDARSKGFYIPDNNIAHVLTEQNTPNITKMHEYFGHGTFVEHSLLWKKVDEQLKNNNVELANYYYGKTLVYNEGFAVWMEDFLSQAIGLEKEFAESVTKYDNAYLEAYARAKSIETLGDFYFKREYGFPQAPTVQKVNEFLTQMKDKDSIQIALLYGSKKPESDVDLFIVSDEIKSFKNHWLDVYAMTSDEYQKSLDNLLINVTDPLFSGQVLMGAKKFMNDRNYVRNLPITEDAIDMNKVCAYKEQEMLRPGLLKGKDEENALGYVRTFTDNARYLSQGVKLLTKQQVQAMEE